MKEAPAATNDAPDDRNDLLPIVLLFDITPPFSWLAVHVHVAVAAQKPEGGYQILRTVVGIER